MRSTSRRSGIASASRRHTPSVRSFSRSSRRPPSEDWLPPLKSTVSFLRQTDGRSKGSGISSDMAAVAEGNCASQFVETPICYVNRGLHATVAAKFSRLMNFPGETERFRGFEVDYQFVLVRCLHRQVRGLLAF